MTKSYRDKFDSDEWQDRPVWETETEIRNEFLTLLKGTVSDRVTGLMWQQSGHEQTLNWQDAHHYTLWLNQSGFCNFSDWRLPTIDELGSLYGHGEMELEGGPPGDESYSWRSFSEEFDDRQWMCWSGDMALEGRYTCPSAHRNETDLRVSVTVPNNSFRVYNFGWSQDDRFISTGILGAVRDDDRMFVRGVRTEATNW